MADNLDKFLWSIQNGALDDVKRRVAEDDSVVCAAIKGRYPIHHAADYGQMDILEFLLSKGAKINEPDTYGITPLLAAIYEKHTPCVKVLLEKGADKKGKSPDGRTLEECAETPEIQKLFKAEEYAETAEIQKQFKA